MPGDKLGPEERIYALGIWRGSIDITPIGGGITNRNYLVTEAGRRFFVRLGDDIPHHHILRSNELAASMAAEAAGISPAVVHHQPGILVFDYLEAKTLTPDDIRRPDMLSRLVPLLKSCHEGMPRYFRGTALIFWVFHVVRDYIHRLLDGGHQPQHLLHALLEKSERLEKAAGPFHIAFGHNDLLAANILDDGKRLWLIDWDYAGFNTPLFDLGGLASNSGLCEASEWELLELYFSCPADSALWNRFRAMKCASLLRETLWSMMSEIHSTISFDYAAYTATNLALFERSYDDFCRKG